jgi:hypothetical protein
MRVTLFFFFIVFLLIQNSIGQEILDQTISSCDHSKRPDLIKDRIIKATFKDSILHLQLGFKANCSFSPQASLKSTDDTLYIIFNPTSNIRAMCDCCFESSFEIILESEPQTIMFKKVGSFEKGGFYEITKSDKWYHDFNIFRFREVEEISNDFMFNYNFFVSAESSDECFGQSKEVESLDTMISGRGSNLFYTISSCSEPIPFSAIICSSSSRVFSFRFIDNSLFLYFD